MLWYVGKSFIVVGDMIAASKLDKDKLGLLITPQLQIEQKLLFSFKHKEDKGSSLLKNKL